ncbi:MAG: tripartite tricarboxylate transporter permease [Methylocystaceae bacterium]|nr:tripartite tricarboxylate transporter permease [Methylocystaceae bacterium]
MSVFDSILFGFSVALTPTNLLFCWIGALLGTVVGVLPGINVLTTFAILLPLTFKIDPTAAIVMLSGVYYGAHHSLSTTSIMLNMPGEPSGVVICFDGYPMARQGRAGPALAIAALSSFFAGCVGVLIIAFFAPALADASLWFQAPEYTAVCILALIGASVVTSKSKINTLGMAVIGLILGTVGTDLHTGTARFTFGKLELDEGLDFVSFAAGLFAFVEIAFQLGSYTKRVEIKTKLRELIPRWVDIKAAAFPTIRGTALGAALGVLPGTGPFIASYSAYALENRIAKDPSRFGNGAIEGVAAPEAANNASAFTHYIPMLTLGIPAGAVFSMLMGALMMHGIHPGPDIMEKHPDLFWGLIASMWLGNLMLLVLNLPLIGIWIKLLETPYRYIYPSILLLTCIGCYAVHFRVFDIQVAAFVLLAGYVLEKLDCAPGPVIIAMILGPILEENMRRALLISGGDPTVFIRRPISATFLILALLLIITYVLPAFMGKKGDQRLSSDQGS